MSVKDRNLRSNSVMSSSAMDHTELTLIIREEIGMAFDIKLRPIKESIDSLQETMKATSSKLREVEESVTDNDRRLTDVEKKCANLHSENTTLITGIPSEAEEEQPTAFVNNLLRKMFVADKLGEQPCVNFAYRTGSRCMIARLFSLETKRTIIRLAGEAAGNLKFQGKKIHMYPNFSADLLKRTAAFKDVKNILREAGVKHGILHPCKLIITHQKTTVTFTDAKEAMTYYDQVIKLSLCDAQA
ncbi:hypothetical protein ABVT39_026749 [Epinephelus coioides]